MVRKERFELSRVSPYASETYAYTNSATSASIDVCTTNVTSFWITNVEILTTSVPITNTEVSTSSKYFYVWTS